MRPINLKMTGRALQAAATFALALIVLSSPGAAEESLDDVLAAHCEARAALKSLEADFTQTRVFTIFEEEEVSSGEFFFLHPGRVLWQFYDPDSSRTVLRGDTGWTVLPGVKQVQRITLGGSSTDRVLSIVGFGPCGGELADYFDIEMMPVSEGPFHLHLSPIDDAISPYFSVIELFLDREDFLPRRIVFTEISEDLVIFEFSRMESGVDIDESKFEWSVPEGFEVLEY
jgi:outer membrane lipoprotein-sorting protein